jgi:hypothetical protein
MKAMQSKALLFGVVLGLTACSQEAEQEDAAAVRDRAGEREQAGSAEQLGRQIDQSVEELRRRAKEAESSLGDRLIETGEALKQE